MLTEKALCVYDYPVDRDPRLIIELKSIIKVSFEDGEGTIVVEPLAQSPFHFQVASMWERREWLRKLRRVAENISTNELCPAEVTHEDYVSYVGRQVNLYCDMPAMTSGQNPEENFG